MSDQPLSMGQSVVGPKEILVVDDTPNNLRLLLRALTEEGYVVRCAKSPAMALTRIQAAAPALVLLDIRMPQMSGYEFCQRLKADAKTREIPVIFLSVLNAPEDKVRAFELGGVDYIPKPYQVEEVLARVRYHFQAHQNQHQLTLEVDRLRQENATQRQSLVQLNKSYQLLNEVLNGLADGIAAFRAIRNQQGIIEDFQWMLSNTTLAGWLGRSPSDLPGTSLDELLASDLQGNLFEQFIQVVEQHESLQVELLMEPDGQIPTWFELMATSLGDGLVAQLRNIDQYKQVVTRLEATIAQLQVLTTQDSLTQLANRRSFDQYLQAEWQRLARLKEPLSLIMGDIDRFKQFNDLCGHAVGDQCLRTVSQALMSVVKRPADLVARYGGEEFAILLPHTHLQGALQVARQVQRALATLRLGVPQPECQRVSLSLGVACQRPQLSASPESLLVEADQALYLAKARGGNQICHSQNADLELDAWAEVASEEE